MILQSQKSQMSDAEQFRSIVSKISQTFGSFVRSAQEKELSQHLQCNAESYDEERLKVIDM